MVVWTLERAFLSSGRRKTTGACSGDGRNRALKEGDRRRIYPFLSCPQPLLVHKLLWRSRPQHRSIVAHAGAISPCPGVQPLQPCPQLSHHQQSNPTWSILDDRLWPICMADSCSDRGCRSPVTCEPDRGRAWLGWERMRCCGPKGQISMDGSPGPAFLPKNESAAPSISGTIELDASPTSLGGIPGCARKAVFIAKCLAHYGPTLLISPLPRS